MIRTLTILLLTLITPMLVAGEQIETVTRVELRSTVRLDADCETMTLGDLARISGPQTEQLQSLTISAQSAVSPGNWTELEVLEIREQIKNAIGINFGALVLSGPDIRITKRGQIDRFGDAAADSETESKVTQGTIRQQVERWLLARLKAQPESTRMRFNERDDELLNTPSGDRLIEIREIGRSKRMVLGLVVIEHERVIYDQSIQVEVLIEQPVRVAMHQIKRRSMISEENTRIEQRWLPVNTTTAPPESAIGLLCNATIDPGELVLSSMLEEPLLVKRGEIVSARSIAGSVSVILKARAKESGKIGDIIELESEDREQQFQARIAGRGRVIIIHQPSTPTSGSSS